ncbi:MAG: ECF transporter S component [Ruminococcaceae bacterium]|nr:ECF transporter S component [Oscillospiraceae bacterium]
METTNQKMRMRLLRLIGVALFTALAYVIMLLIHFPVSFLTLDLKDAVITLCGLCFGPISALVSSVTVALVEMVTVSSTGVYGFVMNALSTAAFSVTVSLIYKYKKNFLGAIIGLLSGVFAVTAVMMIFNLIVTPYYMHVEVAQVANMIPTLLLPFNLVKATFNAAVVLLLYKPISTVLQKIGFLPKSNAAFKFDRRTILVSLAAILLIAASLVVVFCVLHGSFRFGV